MDKSTEFTPWDFVKLVKDLSEHEAELKMKMAKSAAANQRAAEDQMSSTRRP